MAVVTRAGVVFTDFVGRPARSTRRSACCGTRSWPRRPATSTSCSRRSSSSRLPCARPILGRVSLETGHVFLDEMAISEEQFAALNQVSILACGTSWHAGLVGKFMIEALARRAGRGRLRRPSTDTAIRLLAPGTLALVITQSGETADTLAALREAKRKARPALAICNVVGSMATRESDGNVLTRTRGPEIGVASTKAFTSQLVALYLLALHLAQTRGSCHPPSGGRTSRRCCTCPRYLEQALKEAPVIEEMAGPVLHPLRLPVPRPRPELPDRPRGRVEAEGDLVHPRRGLSGRRDEARPHRSHRREDAGRGAGAARRVSSRRCSATSRRPRPAAARSSR